MRLRGSEGGLGEGLGGGLQRSDISKSHISLLRTSPPMRSLPPLTADFSSSPPITANDRRELLNNSLFSHPTQAAQLNFLLNELHALRSEVAGARGEALNYNEEDIGSEVGQSKERELELKLERRLERSDSKASCRRPTYLTTLPALAPIAGP